MADVDIGSDTYKALVDIDAADLYLSADARYAAAWAALDGDDKGRKLVTVTRIILRQPLKVEVDIDAPLPALRDAACEFAGAIATGYDLGVDPSASLNVRRQKAGSVEVEYFRNLDAPEYIPPPIPRDAWAILLPLLKSEGALMQGAIATGVGDDDYRPLGSWVGFGSRNYQ